MIQANPAYEKLVAGVKEGKWIVVYTDLAPEYLMVLEKNMEDGKHEIYTFKNKAHGATGVFKKAHAYAQKSSKSALELNYEQGF